MKKLSLLLLIVLVVALAFMGGALSKEEGEGVQADFGADGVQRATIVGGSYFFRPDHVTVKVNVPVQLTVRKEPGMVPHNFLLKAPEAGIDVQTPLATEPKTVTFVPTRTGTFHYYCDKKLLFFHSHRDKGMAGVLEVVP